jgi:Nbl1 / Borealin N terminal
MAPPRKRQKVSTASLSTDMSLSRNVSAASTHSTPPHTPPSQSQTSPPQGAGIFTPNHVKHLIANLDIERTTLNVRMILTIVVRDRATRLRNHYNLLASTLRIRGEARMSRVPSHLRGIKIKELRDMQKGGVGREKQLYTDVLGTRLLASASRPTLKRYVIPLC